MNENLPSTSTKGCNEPKPECKPNTVNTQMSLSLYFYFCFCTVCDWLRIWYAYFSMIIWVITKICYKMKTICFREIAALWIQYTAKQKSGIYWHRSSLLGMSLSNYWIDFGVEIWVNSFTIHRHFWIVINSMKHQCRFFFDSTFNIFVEFLCDGATDTLLYEIVWRHSTEF